MRRYAEENRIDVVIYDHVHREGDQHFFVTMEVYERYHGDVTLVVQEQTERLNYLFELVDRVAHEVVEGYSGEVLRFGTLRVSVSPRGIGYRVYVDGERMEDDVRQIEYVLAGEREVEIRQARMFGEVVIASRRVGLADGETVRIDATLPERTEREAEALAAARYLIEGEFEAAWALYERLGESAGVFDPEWRAAHARESAFLRRAIDGAADERLSYNTAWPEFLIGTGLALAGGATYLFLGGPDERLAATGDALIGAYNSATDPTEIQNLGTQIARNYTLANAIAIGKWAGVGLASGSLSLGVLKAVDERTRDSRGGPRERAIREAIRPLQGRMDYAADWAAADPAPAPAEVLARAWVDPEGLEAREEAVEEAVEEGEPVEEEPEEAEGGERLVVEGDESGDDFASRGLKLSVGLGGAYLLYDWMGTPIAPAGIVTAMYRFGRSFGIGIGFFGTYNAFLPVITTVFGPGSSRVSHRIGVGVLPHGMGFGFGGSYGIGINRLSIDFATILGYYSGDGHLAGYAAVASVSYTLF